MLLSRDLFESRDILKAVKEVSLKLSVNKAVLSVICDINILVNTAVLSSSGFRWLCMDRLVLKPCGWFACSQRWFPN